MPPDLERPRKKKRRGSSVAEPVPLRDTPLSLIDTADVERKMLKSFTERDEALRAITTCKICFRPLYEPFTNQCGHTYCYSCLCQWFRNTNGARKTCPDCRTVITRAPAPAYALREVTRELLQRPELLPREEIDGHAQWQSEEAAAVEKDRSNPDPNTGGLFKGCFRQQVAHHPRLAPLLDVEDGVMRCPECAWELEGEHPYCGNCGYEFESDQEPSWSSDNGEDGDNLDGEIGTEDELDGDMSLEDLDFNQSMNAESNNHSLSLSPHSASSSGLGFGSFRFSDNPQFHRGISRQRPVLSSSRARELGADARYQSYNSSGQETHGLDYDDDNDDDDDDDNDDDDDDDCDDDENSSMNSFVVNDEAVDVESEADSESSSSTTRQLRPNATARRLRYTIIDSEDDESSQNSTNVDATDESNGESGSESSDESSAPSAHACRRSTSFDGSDSSSRHCFSPMVASSESELAHHARYDGSSDDESNLSARIIPTRLPVSLDASHSATRPPSSRDSSPQFHSLIQL